MRFLQSMRIPVAAVLRDSQAYVRSAQTGFGIHEMKGSLLQDDLETWKPLTDWLDRRSVSLVPTEDPAPALAPAASTTGTLSVSA
jgi:chromosome partitioning protein